MSEKERANHAEHTWHIKQNITKHKNRSEITFSSYTTAQCRYEIDIVCRIVYMVNKVRVELINKSIVNFFNMKV